MGGWNKGLTKETDIRLKKMYPSGGKMLNKRAQGNAFFFLMLGIVFILLGLALAPVLTEVANEAMASSQLDCNNVSISDQTKAICTSVDVMTPVFVWVIFGLAGILLVAIGGRT